MDEGEDAIFGLLSKVVVVCGGEGLDDEVLDLIHQLWRYLRMIIIWQKKEVDLGEWEDGKRLNNKCFVWDFLWMREIAII